MHVLLSIWDAHVLICLIIVCSDIPLSQEFLAWCFRQTGAWVTTERLRQNLLGSDAAKLEELVEKCGKDDDSPFNFSYLSVLCNSHLASCFANWWLLDKHTKLCPQSFLLSACSKEVNSLVFQMRPLQLWSFPASHWGFLSEHAVTNVVFQIGLRYWMAPRGKGNFSS